MTEEIKSSQWTVSITKLNSLSKYNNRSFCYLFLSQCDDDSSVHSYSQVSVFGSELLVGCRLCVLMHSICHNKLSLTAYHVWKILLLSEVCFNLNCEPNKLSSVHTSFCQLFLTFIPVHTRTFIQRHCFAHWGLMCFHITIVGLTSGFLWCFKNVGKISTE